MARFSVRVMRTDTYYDYVEVDASSMGDAFDQVNDMLDDGGWDGVFSGDGHFQECNYWVADVELRDVEI